jgi:hypothetical protein
VSDTIKQVVPGIIEVNSSTLVIGHPGSGKTFLLATAYEYVWETYKKVSLHYNADPGGFPDKLRALAAVGIVRIWRMQSRGIEYSFETAQLAARGYWPAIIEPKSGMSPKNVPMIPPVVTTYVEACGHCQQVAGRSIVLATLLRGTCPHCGKIRSNQTSKVTSQQTVSRGFENIGTRGYDGLTSISDWYMQDMSHRVELGGEQSSLGGKINSGSLSWQQNNRAQVGFAQARAHELVTSSLEIPGMVVMPLWTALSDESTDEGGLPIVGPKLSGSAKTDIAPAWFGNVFEARLDVDADQGRKQRRLYLSSFIDKQNRNHLLRHRGDPRLVPEVVSDQPYDAQGNPPAEIGTEFNLGHVFRQLDASLQKTVDDVAQRYPDAPGLENVPSHYGMDVPPEALQQTAAVQTGPTPSAKPVVRAPSAPRVAPKPRTAVAGPAAATAQEPAQIDTSAVPASVPTEQAPTSRTEVALPLPLTPPAAAAEPAAVAAAAPAEEFIAVNFPTPAGAWAPPPGAARLSAPRAPAQAPKARPISRPVAPATTKA